MALRCFGNGLNGCSAERFDSDVKLDSLTVSLFPGIGVTGGGLVLRQKGQGGKAPVLRLKRFSARTGILELFRSPPHIDKMRLDGLEIDVTSHHGAEGAPPEERAILRSTKSTPTMRC